MFAEIVSLVAAGLLATAYFERKTLKTEALGAKAEFVAASEKFIIALRTRESQIRARIFSDVTKVLSDAKAEATKLEELVKSGEGLVDGRAKALVAKIEADLKKVI